MLSILREACGEANREMYTEVWAHRLYEKKLNTNKFTMCAAEYNTRPEIAITLRKYTTELVE